MTATDDRGIRSVAVVLSGAGARGAYEAGVLSTLLPHLARAGITPDLYVGTSAGAINAAVAASAAHLPPTEQATAVLDVWRGIASADVFRPVLRTAPITVGHWLGQLLGVPGVRLFSLLDTSPLRETAARRVPWEQLRTNVDAGRTALAIVATSVANQRTVVFVDRRSTEDLPPSDDARPIDYTATRITAEHVLASAAIPVLFPAVWLDDPQVASGWHMDGGVRLNTPLKPALSLGADAVIVLGTHPVDHPASSPTGTADLRRPDVDDALVQLLDAALVDRMVEDVQTLTTVNVLVEGGGQRTSGRRPLTVVPWLFFGPDERRTLGALAAASFDQRYGRRPGTWQTLRHPDLLLLGRLLGGTGPRRGDLMSYLFFDPGFLQAAIEQGQQDASTVLTGAAPGTLPWRTRGVPGTGGDVVAGR